MPCVRVQVLLSPVHVSTASYTDDSSSSLPPSLLFVCCFLFFLILLFSVGTRN
eukprot:m.30807 g.30807  ORF g.30807 m.30807 type:complete len:53 (+) comp10642_c0_seq4:107-265(+)